ncbi:hypothetical protein QYM36_005758 [Artemia franciscana]|uniref:Uncharacterized protein n=1 Tax=Artemia franciscana TaxID=6661 RepID=A0AA88L691_ARTSF|nr:hypothetical protein QYM36_005758 [Artemia franciscana]
MGGESWELTNQATHKKYGRMFQPIKVRKRVKKKMKRRDSEEDSINVKIVKEEYNSQLVEEVEESKEEDGKGADNKEDSKFEDSKRRA